MAQESPVPPITTSSENAERTGQVVKIKEEKIDPEIEKKIKELKTNKKSLVDDHLQKSDDNGQECQSEDDDDDSSQSSSQQEEDQAEEPEDEKKNIEPVKSSNEILAELFKVFNAAPPQELLDDKNLIEKTLKRKKEKKKKHKKNKSNGEHTDSGNEAKGAGSTSKHKKKKKHKHKHKDEEKDKDKSKEKKKSKDTNEKDKSKDKEKSREKKKSKDKDKCVDIDKLRGKDRGDAAKHTNNSDDKHSIRKDSSDHRRHDHKRHHEKDAADNNKRRKTDDKDEKQNSFYGRDRNHHKDLSSQKDKHHETGKDGEIKIKKEVVEKSSSRKISDGEISEISLSDEEVYLERREKETDYRKYKGTNSFYAGSNRSRSRETDRTYNKDRFRNHDGDRDRDLDRDNYHHRNSRGASGRNYYSRRSKSRSRSRDLGIDKKRLLEIARKNAISMFKRGNLPGCDNMTEDVKDKVLLKMRYGGRTVEDLTEFCKKISNGEHLSDLSSDEGSDVDKGGNAKAFHHPFQLKEREPIVMHIRNSKPILPAAKTEEQTKTITMQFPVSSGQQHRMTEAWVPVEPKDRLPPLPALPTATQSTSIFKSTVTKNALGKPLPTESEQEPAFKPVEDAIAAAMKSASETPAVAVETAMLVYDVPPPAMPPPPPFLYTPVGVPPPTPVGVPASTLPVGVPPPGTHAIPNNFTPDVPVPSSRAISIFPEAPIHPMDVSSIISKRLNAMRRLQENPMDSEAIKMMYNSQKEMTTWAASKHLPGQFTGSTGVNVLKPSQLNSGPQVWARRDALTSSKPVSGGMGMHLLQKMGWKPGEGLGRDKNGSLQPLLLDVKLDKRGLVAQEDLKPVKQQKRGGGGGGGGGAPQQPQQNPEDKHPVCLLNEMTTKYKWTPPMYKLVHENGPSHSRMFLFSVNVNNESYTPSKLCNTKKEAKFQAAKLCLQKLGILPPG